MVGRGGARPKVVWTVAGFDPSSGAGITADLMTFAAHGLFGCSAITALTVQSTTGVRATEPVRPGQLAETLGCLLEDLSPAGIKIGMLGGRAIAEAVGDFLRAVRRNGATCPVVLDPVLRSSSGRMLYPLDEMEWLHEAVLPMVDWVTPNWGELAVLTGALVGDLGDFGDLGNLGAAERAARGLIERHPGMGVIATGGEADRPVDLLVTAGAEAVALDGERVETTSTHGTGCAFSSAFLSRLVQGHAPAEAARLAKAYVVEALRHAPGLGAGKGPMGLLWPLQESGLG